ncbi:hypothetical protein QR721_03030 [Aciduricibacillus chroicocephali]|uniref:Uncharacterized protein n=1 Tax=Aciduricibacillus chroicocephali TaxID=3054939 RepID=A0ABY9KX50_9BACI|nr:hypothetical protein QR721_03030 [Bacillaceae bacterium 44XB]
MDFIINEAGAKIYENIEHHKYLYIPILDGEDDQGVVYQVMSAALYRNHKHAIVTVREGDRKATAYRVPDDLYNWVESLIRLNIKGNIRMPLMIEFCMKENHLYAKVVERLEWKAATHIHG